MSELGERLFREVYQFERDRQVALQEGTELLSLTPGEGTVLCYVRGDWGLSHVIAQQLTRLCCILWGADDDATLRPQLISMLGEDRLHLWYWVQELVFCEDTIHPSIHS